MAKIKPLEVLEQIKTSSAQYEAQAGNKPEELRISMATWRDIKKLSIDILKEAVSYKNLGGIKAACLYDIPVITEFGYVVKNSMDDIVWPG